MEMNRALVGTIVFGAGVILVIGNLTGLLVTFPFAGFLTTLVGGAIIGTKKSSNSSDQANPITRRDQSGGELPVIRTGTGLVTLSPNRRHWFDGQAWRPTAEEAPPGCPVSDDGCSWWDGQQWLSRRPSAHA
jgi:hypothetical protein